MAISLCDLPFEVRNMIYECALLHAEPINPEHLGEGSQRFSLQLLRVNKTVHTEASPIFYGRNCFSLVSRDSSCIASFLDQIRPRNARYIEDVRIRLETFRFNTHARDDYLLQVLAKIRSCCPNLRTLTGLPHYLSDVCGCNRPSFLPRAVSDRLSRVNAEMRLFKCLKEVVVEISRDNLRDMVQRDIDKYGWKTKVVKPVGGEDPEPLFDSGAYGDVTFWDDYRIDLL